MGDDLRSLRQRLESLGFDTSGGLTAELLHQVLDRVQALEAWPRPLFRRAETHQVLPRAESHPDEHRAGCDCPECAGWTR